MDFASLVDFGLLLVWQVRIIIVCRPQGVVNSHDILTIYLHREIGHIQYLELDVFL